MSHFGVSATARASLYLYNTTDDIDRLVDGLRSVTAIFG
jgi:cysteine desulfurase/selenocysteine lyase